MEKIPSLKEQWNSVIEKKLKAGQSLDDLLVEYEDGITMMPNIVSEEIQDIDHHLDLSSAWVNMARIPNDTDVEMNRLIHLALNQGANGLVLDLKASNDYQNVLDGVMTEYLDIIVKSDNEIALDTYKHPNVTVVINDNDQIVELPRNEKISAFRALRDQLDNDKPLFFSISVSKDLLFEIAFLRAVRLYLQEAKFKDVKLYGRFDVEGTNELGDYNLIEKTYKTMSIIIGGADAVISDYKGDEDSRLTLNIQNILDLESSFKQVMDPTKGAYYIEMLTSKILERLKG